MTHPSIIFLSSRRIISSISRYHGPRDPFFPKREFSKFSYLSRSKPTNHRQLQLRGKHCEWKGRRVEFRYSSTHKVESTRCRREASTGSLSRNGCSENKESFCCDWTLPSVAIRRNEHEEHLFLPHPLFLSLAVQIFPLLLSFSYLSLSLFLHVFPAQSQAFHFVKRERAFGVPDSKAEARFPSR